MDRTTNAGASFRHPQYSDHDLQSPLKQAPIVSLRSLEDGEEDDTYSRNSGVLGRVLRMLRRRRTDREPLPGHTRLSENDEHKEEKERSCTDWRGLKIWRRRRWYTTLLQVCVAAALGFFGIVHLINVIAGSYPLIKDEKLPLFSSWPAKAGQLANLSSIPADLTKGVRPVPCHSHNDYWRKIPLYEALYYGCTGVEADVWLFDDELLVGHDTRSLKKNHTLRSMYVDPIVTMLDARNNATSESMTVSGSSKSKNGIWETKPGESLILLIDFKNDGPSIYPVVVEQLSALRDRGYLTYYDGKTDTVVQGAVTVVGTGNAPYDLITANATYRGIFFDAPLAALYEDPDTDPSSSSSKPHTETTRFPSHLIPRASGQGTVGTSPSSSFTPSTSYYASASFKRSIGWVWFGRLTSHQKKLIRGQIKGAKRAGLKSRYWGTPGWPRGVRNYVWRTLVEEGVDVLNGDELGDMTRGDWRVGRHEGVF